MYFFISYFEFFIHIIFQSTGSKLFDCKNELALEKCLHPKKPLWADRGEGCVDSNTKCFGLFSNTFLFLAWLPHNKKTMGRSNRLILAMIASLKVSQP